MNVSVGALHVLFSFNLFIGEVTPWEWISNFLSSFINTLHLVHSVFNTSLSSVLLPWLVALTILV